MDGDPAVDPELDTFSLYLPLPYRVAFIIVLGMLTQPVTFNMRLISPRDLGLGLESSLLVCSQNRPSCTNIPRALSYYTDRLLGCTGTH